MAGSAAFAGTCAASYRFTFNGMEKDDEVHNATGTSYDFGARIYDSRVGRWLSSDPFADRYPGISPYHFAYNSPLSVFDSDGREGVVTVIRDGNGGGTITLETTIHLYGKDANPELAAAYNREFESVNNTATYTDPSSTGIWTVSININYVYDKALNDAYEKMHLPAAEYMKKPDFVKAGDNILLVDMSLPDEATNGSPGITNCIGGNSGKVRLLDFKGAFHEPGHMIGFDERYTANGLISVDGDMMAAYPSAGKNIAPVHFGDLARAALKYTFDGQIPTYILIPGTRLDDQNYDPQTVDPRWLFEQGGDDSNVSNVRKD